MLREAGGFLAGCVASFEPVGAFMGARGRFAFGRGPGGLIPLTTVCRVDECHRGRRHGWQLEPSGHGFAIGGGGRLRSRGGHLGHCINEAPQPNGTWIGWWLKLAHLDFSAQDAKFNPRGKTWFRTYNRPASSRCRQRGLNAPLHESRKPAGESGTFGVSLPVERRHRTGRQRVAAAQPIIPRTAAAPDLPTSR